MLMQQHFAELLHLPEANFNRQKGNNAIHGVVVVAVVVATAPCRWVATITEFKPKLNNLPNTEKEFLHLLELKQKR